MWVRGLKLAKYAEQSEKARVAPRVGAWIETDRQEEGKGLSAVAPRVGAWIETYLAHV